jgi:hypothetical protein
MKARNLTTKIPIIKAAISGMAVIVLSLINTT